MLLCLLFYLLFTAQAESLTSRDKSLYSCIEKCNSNFKAACERGCALAHALTTAPKSYPFNPSCAESCKDAYPNSVDEVNTCNFGCDAYVADEKPQFGTTLTNWFSSFLGYFRSMLSKIRGQLMPSQNTAPENQPISQPHDQPIVTRIRIFYFAHPLNEAEDPAHAPHPIITDRPPSMHSELQHNRKSGLLMDDREQHQVVDNSRGINQDWRITCLLRNAISDPIRLLFLITLITLLVLLVAQFVLCIRRIRRSNHYNYVALPTYAEAVDIKLPLETNNDDYEGFTKGVKNGDA